MKRLLPAALLILTATAFAAAPPPSMRGDGPPPEARPFRLERVDAGFDAVIARNAKLEELARGFGLNEGPVWMPEATGGKTAADGTEKRLGHIAGTAIATGAEQG